MHRRSRVRAALLAAIATLALTSPVAAGDFRSDSTVTIGEGESIEDDLYVGAGTAIIDGTVNGDASVGGGTVQVNGTITGSLNVAGGTVEIFGDVNGAVRVSGGTVRIAGSVGRDVVAFAGTVTIDSPAEIAGDVAGGIGQLVLSGAVGGDLLVEGGMIQVSGSIDGSVDVGVDELTIASGAVVGGDVTYRSANEASIADGAVAGEVTREEPAAGEPQPSIVSENPIVTYLGTLLGMLLLGWGLLWVRPRLTIGSGAVLRTAPLLSLGIGFGTLIGQFVLIVILALAAVLVGILAGALGGAFVAVALVVLLLVVLAIIFASVPVAMAIGQRVLPGDRSPYLALLAGAAILSLVIVGASLLPALGALVFFCVWILGLGAFVVYGWRTRERPYVLVEPPPPTPAGPMPAANPPA
jgi:cytoskeletal protein CcmA (bactofilin family)